MRAHTILTRLILLSIAAIPLHAAPQIHGREISIEADDVQSFVSKHFPQSKALLGGLIELSTSRPHIAMPPGNRITLSFDLAITSSGSQASLPGRV
ncbi:MAG TPA: DUF1439 domain-containing protein, partial [Xylella sp.]